MIKIKNIFYVNLGNHAGKITKRRRIMKRNGLFVVMFLILGLGAAAWLSSANAADDLGCLRTIGPSGAISGVVADNVTGEPIAGAQVLITPQTQGLQDQGINAINTTDENGEFACTCLKAGMWNIMVIANDYNTFQQTGIEVFDGKITEVEINMVPRKGTITGKVKDAKTKLAIEGGMVFAIPQVAVAVDQPPEIKWVAITDAQGNYTINDIMAGTWTLVVYKQRYNILQHPDVNVNGGEITQVNLELTPWTKPTPPASKSR